MKRLLTPLALLLAAAITSAAPATEDLVQLAEEVARDVEALRGWKFKKPVKKAMVTEDEMAVYFEKAFDREFPGPKLPHLQAIGRMLGVLPEDRDVKEAIIAAMKLQAAGFYDPDAETFFVVAERAKSLGPALVRILIAHELTHALDDQHLGLRQYLLDEELTQDQKLARLGVAEGSATCLMQRYQMKLMAEGKLSLEDIMAVAQAQSGRNARFLAEAPPYLLAWMGTYPCGANFLMRGKMMEAMMGGGGNVAEDLKQATERAPASTEQLLHPEKYWDPARADAPVLIDDAAMTKRLAAPGRSIVCTETIGEMLAAAATRPESEPASILTALLPQNYTSDAASGWGGDRFYLLAAGDGDETLEEAKGVWVTVWDTEADRDQFLAAMATARPKAVARKIGTLGAVFLFGFDAKDAASLADTLEQSPPPLQCNGKAWSFWVL